ncbi:MAG TPA: 30S ribosomal protein S6 [Chloroflexota bacterium]|nr:30S ribosomal protein S6 [Chloroflexota bacterium]
MSPRMGHACVDSRKGGRRLRDYEILFILPPDLEEEEATATTERVRASVVSRGGEVKSLEVWGRRRLAYPIQRYQEGVYHIGRFSLGPEQEVDLDRSLRLSEQILRHLILKIE